MLTMKDIIDDKNPLIRQISQEVEVPLSEENEKLLREMHEFLVNSQDEEMAKKYDLRPGVGLAAPQLGQLKRMIAILVYDFDKDGNITGTTQFALANPKLLSYSAKYGYLRSGEGCLSVEDEHPGYVNRHYKVRIRAYDLLTDKWINITARGYLAMVFQHEMDHLDGKLFYDYIDPEDPQKVMPDAQEI